MYSSLDEQVVHLTVKVEVRQGLVLELIRVEAEKTRQGVVRADLAAVGRVLEVVGLDVVPDATAHIRPAYKGAGGLAEELAKLVRNGNRLLKAAVGARLALRALSLRGLAHKLDGLLDGGLYGSDKDTAGITDASVLGAEGIDDAREVRDELVSLYEFRGGIHRSSLNRGSLDGGSSTSVLLDRGSGILLSAASTAGTSVLCGGHSSVC